MAFVGVSSGSGTAATVRRSVVCQQAGGDQVSTTRRDFLLSVAGAGIIAAFPQNASANVNLMAAKRSYFRYVPRIEEGINYFVLDLTPAVESQDWEKLQQAFIKTSVARPGSEKAANDIDQKTTILERLFFTPMKTWSNSFAEKGTSPKSRAMLTKEAAFEVAMSKLEKSTKARDAAGATESLALARDKFNEYLEVANKGLSMELRKVDLIPEDASSFKELGKRPTTTF